MHKGSAIGKGIDFHDFDIMNNIDFCNFGVGSGIDVHDFGIQIDRTFLKN